MVCDLEEAPKGFGTSMLPRIMRLSGARFPRHRAVALYRHVALSMTNLRSSARPLQPLVSGHHRRNAAVDPGTGAPTITSTKHKRVLEEMRMRPRGQNGGSQFQRGELAPPLSIQTTRIKQFIAEKVTIICTKVAYVASPGSVMVSTTIAATSATTSQSILVSFGADGGMSPNYQSVGKYVACGSGCLTCSWLPWNGRRFGGYPNCRHHNIALLRGSKCP
jgi:hypothetical protein